MSGLQWDRAFALEQAGDDEELLEELLVLLREASTSDLLKIEAALAKGDRQAMAEAAHSIKGAAASLGIESLRQVAADIERAGQDDDLSAASVLVSDLAVLVRQLASLCEAPQL